MWERLFRQILNAHVYDLGHFDVCYWGVHYSFVIFFSAVDFQARLLALDSDDEYIYLPHINVTDGAHEHMEAIRRSNLI